MTKDFLTTLDAALNSLLMEAEELQSRWDGDNPGADEDNAHLGKDIEDKVGELRELLMELSEDN